MNVISKLDSRVSRVHAILRMDKTKIQIIGRIKNWVDICRNDMPKLAYYDLRIIISLESLNTRSEKSLGLTILYPSHS